MEAVSAGRSPSVYVINDQRQIEERPVTLGMETPSHYEVLTGLKEGDLVLIGSRSQVKPGRIGRTQTDRRPGSTMNPPLTPEQLEALRRLDACTLANAIETFHERLRNEGFIDQTVRCLFPRLPPMLGYAATVKIRGSAPPTADGVYRDRTDWWDYILSLPAPRVVVVQDIATRRVSGRWSARCT